MAPQQIRHPPSPFEDLNGLFDKMPEKKDYESKGCSDGERIFEDK